MKYFFLLIACFVFAKVNQGCIEATAAYYHPLDGLYRKIYSERILFGVRGSYYFDRVGAFVGVNGVPASGKSLSGNPRVVPASKTDLWLVPIETGLEYVYPIRSISGQLRLAAAVAPFYVRLKDDSPFVVRKRTKWDVGGSLCSGFRLFPKGKNVFIDLNLSYFYLKTSFKTTELTVGNKTDFSGISVGGGLGYCF